MCRVSYAKASAGREWRLAGEAVFVLQIGDAGGGRTKNAGVAKVSNARNLTF
jgi:hypothetical protein